MKDLLRRKENGRYRWGAPMLKHHLESMLVGELDCHLQKSKASGKINRKTERKTRRYRSLHARHFELGSGT
ncbi:hypothetical protein PQ465_03650 [Sphingobacterium oryzagri]|uniref:Uncharacterized protein n=1 Tax=Sphingobacterium oryzagri TaxID=3025669 RepID=A0ABY7WM46_9SPHI|nr:hypothetical protein [Sphingobacterium sp. KACC 22765]WDF69478.1 hypothetical protein PQ465_03650 [Sphingobacterium sp. KACC 22765]